MLPPRPAFKKTYSRTLTGFSLVELTVAIALIGTLVVLLFPTFHGALMQGKQAATISNMRQIGQGVNLYASENNGTLPGPMAVTVYSYSAANPPDSDVATLASYIGKYLGAKMQGSTANYSIAAMCFPLLSKSDQYTGMNYAMMDLFSTNPTYAFGGGLGSIKTLATARLLIPQPQKVFGLNDIERRTCFLTTGDQQLFPANTYLPNAAPFNGKRPWLFLDGSIALSTNSTAWTH